MNNDFLNDDIKDALIERDGFRQQVEDFDFLLFLNLLLLKEIHLYLVGRFNETQDTKYLDDLIKFQEMCGDYYG